jgi:hypothetical protein
MGEGPEAKTGRRNRLLRPRLSGVIAMTAAAAFIAWLALRPAHEFGNTASAPVARASAIDPVILSQDELSARVPSLGQPLYWAGPMPGRRYELMRATTGNVYVRYLPPDAVAGDQRPFLTIGTYPAKDAFATVRTLTQQPGAVSRELPGGGVAYYHPERSSNVYLVYPNLDYQIEVYSPWPGQARDLVESGRIHPLG